MISGGFNSLTQTNRITNLIHSGQIIRTTVEVHRTSTTQSVAITREQNEPFSNSAATSVDIESLCDCILSSLAMPYLGLVAVTAISQSSHISIILKLNLIVISLISRKIVKSSRIIRGKLNQAYKKKEGMRTLLDLGWLGKVYLSYHQPTSTQSQVSVAFQNLSPVLVYSLMPC